MSILKLIGDLRSRFAGGRRVFPFFQFLQIVALNGKSYAVLLPVKA